MSDASHATHNDSWWRRPWVLLVAGLVVGLSNAGPTRPTPAITPAPAQAPGREQTKPRAQPTGEPELHCRQLRGAPTQPGVGTA